MHDRGSIPSGAPTDANGAEHSSATKPAERDNTEDDEDDDDDDDPNLLLKPSQYESLICGSCVRSSALLSRWAGSPGVRMIIWKESTSPSSTPGSWVVLGEDVEHTKGEDIDVDVEHELGGDSSNTSQPTAANSGADTTASTVASTALKRARSPTATSLFSPMADETSPAPKRARGNDHSSTTTNDIPIDSTGKGTSSAICHAPNPELAPAARDAILSSSRGPFIPSKTAEYSGLKDGDSDADLFLSEGWRERWCRCSDVSLTTCHLMRDLTGVWRAVRRSALSIYRRSRI